MLCEKKTLATSCCTGCPVVLIFVDLFWPVWCRTGASDHVLFLMFDPFAAVWSRTCASNQHEHEKYHCKGCF